MILSFFVFVFLRFVGQVVSSSQCFLESSIYPFFSASVGWEDYPVFFDPVGTNKISRSINKPVFSL